MCYYCEYGADARIRRGYFHQTNAYQHRVPKLLAEDIQQARLKLRHIPQVPRPKHEEEDVGVDVKTSGESDSGPERTLHRFSEFPYEIRFQIWELSIFAPRVVGIKRIPTSRSTSPIHIPRISCVAGPPAALSINHETRSAALPRYIFTSGDFQLFLDPTIDTLYCGARTAFNTIPEFINFAPEADFSRVRRLLVDDNQLHKLLESGPELSLEQWLEGKEVDGYNYPQPWEVPVYMRLHEPLELLVTFVSPSGLAWLKTFYECEPHPSNNWHCEKCQAERREAGGVRVWRLPLREEFMRGSKDVQRERMSWVGFPVINPEEMADMGCERLYKSGLRAGIGRGMFNWIWKWVHGI